MKRRLFPRFSGDSPQLGITATKHPPLPRYRRNNRAPPALLYGGRGSALLGEACSRPVVP